MQGICLSVHVVSNTLIAPGYLHLVRVQKERFQTVFLFLLPKGVPCHRSGGGVPGRGYPIPGPGSTSSQVQGVPHPDLVVGPVPGWGVPHPRSGGVPHPDWIGGYPIQTWWGVYPIQTWSGGTPQTGMGYPPS